MNQSFCLLLRSLQLPYILVMPRVPLVQLSWVLQVTTGGSRRENCSILSRISLQQSKSNCTPLPFLILPRLLFPLLCPTCSNPLLQGFQIIALRLPLLITTLPSPLSAKLLSHFCILPETFFFLLSYASLSHWRHWSIFNALLKEHLKKQNILAFCMQPTYYCDISLVGWELDRWS